MRLRAHRRVVSDDCAVVAAALAGAASIRLAICPEFIVTGNRMSMVPRMTPFSILMMPLTSREAQDFETLYRKADDALYMSKKNGRNNYTLKP